MKIQGHLMEVCFIEINKVFGKINKVGYFSNRGVYFCLLGDEEGNPALLDDFTSRTGCQTVAWLSEH
jgi:hypothetical protein